MNESSPEVGSSQNIRGGSVRTSLAKDSLFISPPEIPLSRPWIPMTVFWHFDRASCLGGKKFYDHHKMSKKRLWLYTKSAMPCQQHRRLLRQCQAGIKQVVIRCHFCDRSNTSRTSAGFVYLQPKVNDLNNSSLIDLISTETHFDAIYSKHVEGQTQNDCFFYNFGKLTAR